MSICINTVIGGALLFITMTGIVSGIISGRNIFILNGSIFVTVILVRLILPEFILTFFHELRHAAVVLLTGQNLTSFKIGFKGGGSITYDMEEGKEGLAGYITLAPYFLPVFSVIPVLIYPLISFPYELQLIGLLLGLDLLISFTDLSPIQTDFSRVGGLRIVSLMFLATFHLLWFSIAWAFVSFQYEELGDVILFLVERLNQ